MKKLTVILIVILLFYGISFGTEVSINCEKAVNGDYKQSFNINYIFAKYGCKEMYPQAYLNTSAVFLAPRTDITKANHEYFGIIFGAMFKLPTNAILDLSTSGQYWWGGNSQGYNEGLIFDLNKVSILWNF